MHHYRYRYSKARSKTVTLTALRARLIMAAQPQKRPDGGKKGRFSPATPLRCKKLYRTTGVVLVVRDGVPACPKPAYCWLMTTLKYLSMCVNSYLPAAVKSSPW